MDSIRRRKGQGRVADLGWAAYMDNLSTERVDSIRETVDSIRIGPLGVHSQINDLESYPVDSVSAYYKA